MTEKKIFIGWSGRTGQKLAETFRDTLGYYPGLEYLMSGDLGIGSNWFKGVEKYIDEADYCIGFVSPGTYRRIWFNFEAGYIFHKFRNYPLVLLGDKELLLKSQNPIPMQFIQSVSGNDEIGMIKLMKEIIGDEAREKILKQSFAEWLGKYNALEEQLEWELQIESTIEPLLDSVPNLKYDDELKENDSLKLLITESINELGSEIRKIKEIRSFSAPAAQWSYNLVNLKDKFGEELKLKAVSIIDQQDTFWRDQIGRDIATRSNPDTDERIFVFTSETDLNSYFEIIIEHAKRYKVRVTTMHALASLFPSDAKDLGILYTEDSQLLALYDRTESQKKIRYSMSPKEIEKYKKVFEGIKKISKKIPKEDLPTLSDIKEELFDEIESQRRFVEMSVYTSVWDYHTHSNKHPYYKKMSNEMIRIFKEHRKNNSERCKILEFGAGTGNFTEKLAKIPNADVLAFEIDWAYFNIASYRLSQYEHVKLEYADARKVDPEGPKVKYKYIFSCFLDHHMKVTDKVDDKIKYLRNVRKNLEVGGLFIVGDSFLRDFNTKDDKDRENAILDYHQHIIEITKNKAASADFARMEKRLLDDKLDDEKDDVKDYKVSLKQYEEYLHKAGLKVKGSPKKIGPSDIDNVGGVYVYTIELA